MKEYVFRRGYEKRYVDLCKDMNWFWKLILFEVRFFPVKKEFIDVINEKGNIRRIYERWQQF